MKKVFLTALLIGATTIAFSQTNSSTVLQTGTGNGANVE